MIQLPDDRLPFRSFIAFYGTIAQYSATENIVVKFCEYVCFSIFLEDEWVCRPVTEVIFDNLTYNGTTKTEAFIYTIQKCLEKSSIDKYLLAVETLPFLTKNSNLDTGCFKSKKTLTIYDEIIYIGKNSSTDAKFKQLTQLCDILDIAPKTILWIEDSNIIFEY